MKTLCLAHFVWREQNGDSVITNGKNQLETDEHMQSSNTVFWMKTEWETEFKTLNRYQRV